MPFAMAAFKRIETRRRRKGRTPRRARVERLEERLDNRAGRARHRGDRGAAHRFRAPVGRAIDAEFRSPVRLARATNHSRLRCGRAAETTRSPIPCPVEIRAPRSANPPSSRRIPRFWSQIGVLIRFYCLAVRFRWLTDRRGPAAAFRSKQHSARSRVCKVRGPAEAVPPSLPALFVGGYDPLGGFLAPEWTSGLESRWL